MLRRRRSRWRLLAVRTERPHPLPRATCALIRLRATRVAERTCIGGGARLCTVEEVEADETRGTGCQHDNAMIWTVDDIGCADGQHVVVVGSTANARREAECRDDAGNEDEAVRCCADAEVGTACTIGSPHGQPPPAPPPPPVASVCQVAWDMSAHSTCAAGGACAACEVCFTTVNHNYPQCERTTPPVFGSAQPENQHVSLAQTRRSAGCTGRALAAASRRPGAARPAPAPTMAALPAMAACTGTTDAFSERCRLANLSGVVASVTPLDGEAPPAAQVCETNRDCPKGSHCENRECL